MYAGKRILLSFPGFVFAGNFFSSGGSKIFLGRKKEI